MNYRSIIVAYLSLLSLSLLDNGRGPASPSILSYFQISKTQLSYVFAIPSIFSMLATLSAKYWLARFGALNSTLWGFAFLGLSSMGVYLAIGQNTFAGVLVSMAVFGLVQSIFGITMNLLVVQSTTIHNRKRFLSGLHSIYGLLAFSSPLIFGAFDQGSRWPLFFVFCATVPFLCLIISLTATKQKRQTKQVAKTKTMTAPVGKKWRLIYGLALSSYVASEVVASSQMVVYLTGGRGFSEIQARYYLSGFFACLTLGRLFFSFRSLPLSNIQFLIISIILSGISFVLGVYVHPCFLSLQALFMAGFFPTFADMLGDRFREGIDYMMSSANFAIGITLGSTQFLFGILAQKYSFQFAYWIAPLCGVLSLCLILFFIRKDVSSFSLKTS